MALDPFVSNALARAEAVIARFYDALNDIQQIVRDPLMDDDEKVEQLFGAPV